MTSPTTISRDHLLAALRCHIGPANGATVHQLVCEITGYERIDSAAEREIRNLVKELRLEGHHICALPGSGYYMAQTPDDLTATCEHLYQRAITSLTQIARMKKIADPDLRGQLHLHT